MITIGKIFVGMDVSLKDIKVNVINIDGDVLAKFTITNDKEGAALLENKVAELTGKTPVDSILFGLEATSVYSWHIQNYIADSEILKPFHPSVIVFRPKIIKDFKSSLGHLPKNDAVDANAIAERLRFGRLPKGCPVDFRYLALQRLTRYRHHIVVSTTREKAYLLSNLFLKFSGLTQDKVLSDNFGAVATELLTSDLDLDTLADMEISELIDFIVSYGSEYLGNPVETAVKLKQLAAKSFRVNSALDRSLNTIIRSCFDNIKSMHTLKKGVEKPIKSQVSSIFRDEYLCLTSVKGIGDVIAAGLISEIGGIYRFENDNALAKFAGLYWSEHQSGEFTAEDSNLRKTGNDYLRYYFVQAAEHMRMYLPEYEQYYSRKYNEARTHQHKRAIVLTARKAVRLIFALLRNNKLYTSQPKKEMVLKT